MTDSVRAMARLEEIDPSSVPDVVARLRNSFKVGKTKSKEFRLQQLRSLQLMLVEREKEITDAVHNDLKKSKNETIFMEFLSTKSEIVTAINNLDSWMKPEHVKKKMADVFNSLFIQREPLGVVCVFSAWNYPMVVLLQPLIAAIAAGNTVLLKPSDVAVCSSNLFLQLIPQYLDPDCCAVVTGGVPVAQAVLKERFDHIIYTGSTTVGKIIMRAASEHLTPVTLEMGGKNPCYVDSKANLTVAGRRITWGKFANAGQTCLAPDYILCNRSIRDKLVESIRTAVKEYYGEDPKSSTDYGRIINGRHFDRIERLLRGGGDVVMGGELDRDNLYIAPTIITDVKRDDLIMGEEIFGPLLPIITVNDADEAIDMINAGEKPLAVYAFTTNKELQNKFLSCTSSGGLTINDVLSHFAVNTLPFGGVGMSGQGAYHGKFGFDTFSHKKACYITTPMTEFLLKIRYPPFTDGKIKRLTSLVVPKEQKGNGYFRCAVLLCVLALLVSVGLRMLGYSII